MTIELYFNFVSLQVITFMLRINQSGALGYGQLGLWLVLSRQSQPSKLEHLFHLLQLLTRDIATSSLPFRSISTESTFFQQLNVNLILPRAGRTTRDKCFCDYENVGQNISASYKFYLGWQTTLSWRNKKSPLVPRMYTHIFDFVFIFCTKLRLLNFLVKNSYTMY